MSIKIYEAYRIKADSEGINKLIEIQKKARKNAICKLKKIYKNIYENGSKQIIEKNK